MLPFKPQLFPTATPKEIMEKITEQNLRRAIAEFEPDQSFGSVPPASSHVPWIHLIFLFVCDPLDFFGGRNLRFKEKHMDFLPPKMQEKTLKKRVHLGTQNMNSI